MKVKLKNMLVCLLMVCIGEFLKQLYLFFRKHLYCYITDRKWTCCKNCFVLVDSFLQRLSSGTFFLVHHYSIHSWHRPAKSIPENSSTFSLRHSEYFSKRCIKLNFQDSKKIFILFSTKKGKCSLNGHYQHDVYRHWKHFTVPSV